MWILRYLITIEFKLQLFVNEGTGNGLSHLPSKWFSSNLWKYMGDCCTPSYLLEINYQVQKVSVGNRHKGIEYAILWTSFSCRFCPKFCQVIQSTRWVILLGFMRWHKDFSVFFNKWLKQAKLEQGKFTWNIRIFFFSTVKGVNLWNRLCREHVGTPKLLRESPELLSVTSALNGD